MFFPKFNMDILGRRLAAAKGRDLVGIEMSGDIVRIAHVRISPVKTEVVNFISRNISEMTEVDVSDLVGQLIASLKAADPVVVNVIPANIAITKNIEVPSVDPGEIREIVNLQAGRHTPYSREEILVGYVDVKVSRHSYTMILLVIIARAIVKRQFDMLERVGLTAEKGLFAPEGLALASQKLFRIKVKETPIGVLHVDEGCTEFNVIMDNKIVFVRSIPIGSRLLETERERCEPRLAEEVKRSLDVYNSENIGQPPPEFIMTGALDGTRKEFVAMLSASLECPVRMEGYLDAVEVSSDALKAVAMSTRVSFLNVLAPLISFDSMKVNLIPEEIILKKNLEERGRELLKAGILGLGLLMVVCLILISKMYLKSAYVKDLNTKYQALNQEAQKLDKSFTRVSLVKKHLASRGYSVKVLSELYDIIAPDIALTDIRFDDQGKFAIRGTAESMSSVFTFVSGMEKSVYFRDVKVSHTTKRKEGGKDLADFEITATLEKGPEL